jgi:four helix bundle protein
MINFENLNVYGEAIKIALDVYKLTTKFPKEERFGMTDQLRRASVSISLNIAEGSSRSKKDFSRFLDMSRGSCHELIPLLKISLELKYINKADYEILYSNIEVLLKRINALRRSLK